jgi:DNA-binding beta-propeller fold protein YncE
MNNKSNRLKVLLAISLISNLMFFQRSIGQVNNRKVEGPFNLTNSITLPGISGRIDHLAYNSKQQIIYVAALGNNTIEVVDLKSKKLIHSIKGLHEPQGIRYISENNVIFVANGENGECDIFNADSYQLITSIKLSGDADNVRYDSNAGKIYVGYGEGGIAIIDSKTFKLSEDIKLPGHPESFQLENNSKKIFVNVPDAKMLANIDLNKKSITDKWKIDIATANFPMALDDCLLVAGNQQNYSLLIVKPEKPLLLLISTEILMIFFMTKNLNKYM